MHQIGDKIRDTIKIDAHTNHATRGQFTCLCVQVSVDKPLFTTVHIGDHTQPIIYEEGINQICFLCGKLGHKDFVCPDIPSPPVNMNSMSSVPATPTTESPTKNVNLTPTPPKNFGPEPWMVVHRKKPNCFGKPKPPFTQNTSPNLHVEPKKRQIWTPKTFQPSNTFDLLDSEVEDIPPPSLAAIIDANPKKLSVPSSSSEPIPSHHATQELFVASASFTSTPPPGQHNINNCIRSSTHSLLTSPPLKNIMYSNTLSSSP